MAAATNMALNGPQTIGNAVGAASLASTDYRMLLLATAVVVAMSAVPIFRMRAAVTPSPTGQ